MFDNTFPSGNHQMVKLSSFLNPKPQIPAPPKGYPDVPTVTIQWDVTHTDLPGDD